MTDTGSVDDCGTGKMWRLTQAVWVTDIGSVGGNHDSGSLGVILTLAVLG